MKAPAMVIGLGSPDRGDDAVGAAVAERVRGVVGDGVEVLTREDPTALVHAWHGRHVVVLVDSMISGGVAAGTVTVRRAGTHDAPLPTYAFAAAGRGGSHAFGVAGAVELSRTLGTLPEHVAIVGIESTTFEHGPMSPKVEASIDDAVAAVCAELASAGIATKGSSTKGYEAGTCA
ncbi:hydrogenase maturation protease [Demequina lutea]|uniref:Hydrogenase maturation protease n=1 Tax=Demequina lutea TaxID=431489 RepID=A0A7Y9ZDP0_9MICO|nr:hydrogenase maturation protease [Demequina lutea]NYI42678.1 hydrogenase maturation protease [Demequina lutea]